MNLAQAQKILRLLGYSVNTDGQFTLQTQQAFSDLQRMHGLSESGTLDLWTEAKLIELSKNAVPYFGPPPSTGAEVVATSSSSNEAMMRGVLYGSLATMGVLGGIGYLMLRRSMSYSEKAEECHCKLGMYDDPPEVFEAEYEILEGYE